MTELLLWPRVKPVFLSLICPVPTLQEEEGESIVLLLLTFLTDVLQCQRGYLTFSMQLLDRMEDLYFWLGSTSAKKSYVFSFSKLKEAVIIFEWVAGGGKHL